MKVFENNIPYEWLRPQITLPKNPLATTCMFWQYGQTLKFLGVLGFIIWFVIEKEVFANDYFLHTCSSLPNTNKRPGWKIPRNFRPNISLQ